MPKPLSHTVTLFLCAVKPNVTFPFFLGTGSRTLLPAGVFLVIRSVLSSTVVISFLKMRVSSSSCRVKKKKPKEKLKVCVLTQMSPRYLNLSAASTEGDDADDVSAVGVSPQAAEGVAGFTETQVILVESTEG